MGVLEKDGVGEGRGGLGFCITSNHSLIFPSTLDMKLIADNLHRRPTPVLCHDQKPKMSMSYPSFLCNPPPSKSRTSSSLPLLPPSERPATNPPYSFELAGKRMKKDPHHKRKAANSFSAIMTICIDHNILKQGLCPWYDHCFSSKVPHSVFSSVLCSQVTIYFS